MTIYDKRNNYMPFDREEFIEHIKTTLADYFSTPSKEERDLIKDIRELGHKDTATFIEEFEKKITSEVIEIVSYTYYLKEYRDELQIRYLNRKYCLSRKKDREDCLQPIDGDTPLKLSKPLIKNIGMYILALRLSRLNERSTVLQAEKRRVERGDKNKIFKEYTRAVKLSSDIFGYDPDRPKGEMRNRTLGGIKTLTNAIKSYYEGGSERTGLEQTIQSMQELFYLTEAPEDFTILELHHLPKS